MRPYMKTFQSLNLVNIKQKLRDETLVNHIFRLITRVLHCHCKYARKPHAKNPNENLMLRFAWKFYPPNAFAKPKPPNFYVWFVRAGIPAIFSSRPNCVRICSRKLTVVVWKVWISWYKKKMKLINRVVSSPCETRSLKGPERPRKAVVRNHNNNNLELSVLKIVIVDQHVFYGVFNFF